MHTCRYRSTITKFIFGIINTSFIASKPVHHSKFQFFFVKEFFKNKNSISISDHAEEVRIETSKHSLLFFHHHQHPHHSINLHRKITTAK
jgi:hypothetical protein